MQCQKQRLKWATEVVYYVQDVSDYTENLAAFCYEMLHNPKDKHPSGRSHFGYFAPGAGQN